LKVCSTDPRLAGKFLLQKWAQSKDGQLKYINRLLAQKLSAAQLPFDEVRFTEAAKTAVHEQLSYLADAHFMFDPGTSINRDEQVKSGVIPRRVDFLGHRHEVEESPSFKGMYTMYHLYTMEIVCENLPMADFTSLSYRRSKISEGERPLVGGWHWTTWEETMDILHARTATLERRDNLRLRGLESTGVTLSSLSAAIQRLGSKVAGDSHEMDRVKHLTVQLQRRMVELRATTHNGNQIGDNEDFARMFPPSMISKMASQTITSEQLLEQADWANVSQSMMYDSARDSRHDCFRTLLRPCTF